jgi:hypothetical protein
MSLFGEPQLKVRPVKILLGLLCAGVLVSCGDDDETGPPSEAEILTHPGSVWTYTVDFNFYSQRDTNEVTVRVLDAGSDGPEGPPTARWEIDYGDTADTSFVYVSGDTVKIVAKYYWAVGSLSQSFVFPLRVGDFWVNPYCCSDTSRVVARDSIQVPSGSYESYKIDRSNRSFNFQLHTTTWFDPAIGIIKQYRSIYDIGPYSEETWELTGYETK